MNKVLKSLMDGASDAGALARSIADSGMRSVSEVFQGTKIFGALTATPDENVEYDETHYVLVPLLGDPVDYAIYTKRVLPSDTGVTNSLPKARIFHVPDETGKTLLEQKLIGTLVNDRMGDVVGGSELADSLEKVADQIDRETSKISGGLLLIGGAVAIVNPLLGVGIAVKGLLPSIGVKASKAGAEYVGNKLRDWNQLSAVSKLKKDASKEVRKLKPRVVSNPLLRSLEAIAANPASDFDPLFDRRNWVDQFEQVRHYSITTEAIQEVYRDLRKTLDSAIYQAAHLQWIDSIVEGPQE